MFHQNNLEHDFGNNYPIICLILGFSRRDFYRDNFLKK